MMNYKATYMLALVLSIGVVEQNLSAANAQCAANSIKVEDLLTEHPQTPIFLANRSSIALVANYWYDGKEVIQLIPAGARVPLGLWNKINFRVGQEPRIYRYNDFGAMIFGKGYKTPYSISFNKFIKGKPCGNVTAGRSVLELSASVSSFFNSGLDVQTLVRPGYDLHIDHDRSTIFPNYALSTWHSTFNSEESFDPLFVFFNNLSPSEAARDRYYAKQILNLPDEFFKNIKTAKAIEGVNGVAQALIDTAGSGFWVGSGNVKQYDIDSLINAVKTAQKMLLDVGLIIDTSDDPRFDVSLMGLR